MRFAGGIRLGPSLRPALLFGRPLPATARVVDSTTKAGPISAADAISADGPIPVPALVPRPRPPPVTATTLIPRPRPPPVTTATLIPRPRPPPVAGLTAAVEPVLGAPNWRIASDGTVPPGVTPISTLAVRGPARPIS